MRWVCATAAGRDFLVQHGIEAGAIVLAYGRKGPECRAISAATGRAAILSHLGTTLPRALVDQRFVSLCPVYEPAGRRVVVVSRIRDGTAPVLSQLLRRAAHLSRRGYVEVVAASLVDDLAWPSEEVLGSWISRGLSSWGLEAVAGSRTVSAMDALGGSGRVGTTIVCLDNETAEQLKQFPMYVRHGSLDGATHVVDAGLSGLVRRAVGPGKLA